MKKTKHFSIGVKALFSGFKLFLTKPCYWHYVIWPLLFSIVLYITGFYLYFAYLHPFLMGFVPEPVEYSQWWSWAIYPLRWLLNISIFLCGIMITLLTVTMVYSTFAAPFFDRMTLSMEKDCFAFEAPELHGKEAVLYFGSSILNALLLNLQTLFWAVILFPLSFLIPYGGTIIYCLVVSYFLGLSFLQYSVEHRAMSRAEFKESLKGNRLKVLGFGVTAYFLLYVPLLAIPLLPIAVSGGVILFNRDFEEQE